MKPQARRRRVMPQSHPTAVTSPPLSLSARPRPASLHAMLAWPGGGGPGSCGRRRWGPSHLNTTQLCLSDDCGGPSTACRAVYLPHIPCVMRTPRLGTPRSGGPALASCGPAASICILPFCVSSHSARGVLLHQEASRAAHAPVSPQSPHACRNAFTYPLQLLHVTCTLLDPMWTMSPANCTGSTRSTPSAHSI